MQVELVICIQKGSALKAGSKEENMERMKGSSVLGKQEMGIGLNYGKLLVRIRTSSIVEPFSVWVRSFGRKWFRDERLYAWIVIWKS